VTQGPEPTPLEPEAEEERRDRRGNLYAMEILFLALIGVVVILAFVEALSYKIVSSRTPFVIMVPLILLIGVHARRLWRVREPLDVRGRVDDALRGGNAHLNKVVGFSLWMVGMVAMITVLGHLAGIFLFCVILMRFLAGERWGLTLIVAAATTLFIFVVFEYAFNIELYRGLIVRWYLGYRDF
jgi:cell division protein FtsW (lipid II flippase)